MPTKGTGWGVIPPPVPALKHLEGMIAAHLPPGYRGMVLDEHEFGLIVTGLRKVRHKLAADARRSKAAGFRPGPQQIDVSVVRAQRLAALMDRLGITARGD